MNKQKIPATLVTGFLGSGKTTLLSNMLKQPSGKRIAVVVNVPCGSGIDSEILRGTDLDSLGKVDRLPMGGRIYHSRNGCMCCAVEDDFARMLWELASRTEQIDHVVIEVPGTELPTSFLKRLNSEVLSEKFTIDSVLTVADGAALSEGRCTSSVSRISQVLDTELQFLYQAQLDIADVVIISKTDLVMPVLRKKLPEKLSSILNHEPVIISMQHGIVRPELLLNRYCHSEERLELDKVNPDEYELSEGFDSIMVRLGKVDSDLLVSRLQMLIHEQAVYRAKGFAELPNKMMRQVVQGVGSRIDRSYDRRWGVDEERSTHLQIIGRGLDAKSLMATLKVAEV